MTKRKPVHAPSRALLTDGFVRYQHDAEGEVIELRLARCARTGYMCMPDDVDDTGRANRPLKTSRAVMSLLLHRVNSKAGGWCEVLDANGDVLLRHPGRFV